MNLLRNATPWQAPIDAHFEVGAADRHCSEQPFVRIRTDLWLDAAKKSGDFLLTNLAKPLSCESRESGPPPA